MGAHSNWHLIINLGNSIIGVAVLAMPFCFKQCGILLGILVLLFCTWLTLRSCSLLMRAGIKSRRRSYEFLAYHTHGATGKFVSEIGMIGMQMGTLIAQIVVIGDLGPAIISKLLGIENTSNLRTFILVLLCLGVGLPMGMLKDLTSVSKGSTFCIGFYCTFVCYILMSSLPNLWSGDWYFRVNLWRPQGLFQCLPILSFSFGCQTQLFIVYEELPEPSLKSITNVISSAVNLCAVAYLLVGFFGYITFHEVGVPGDIIAVFPSTLTADCMKLFFCLSIVMTFPVIIFPCRASIYTLIFAKKTKAFEDTIDGGSYIPEHLFKIITVCIILISMVTGILIPNVEFILGMNGAIMGTLICYIFPALFFLKVIGTGNEGKKLAQVVLFLGVSILLVSTFATLSSQDKGHTHPESHESHNQPNGPLDVLHPPDQQLPPKLTVKSVIDDKVVTNPVNNQKDVVVEQRKEPVEPNAPASNEKKGPDKRDVVDQDIPQADTDKKKEEPDIKSKSDKKLVSINNETGGAGVEKVQKQEEILKQLEKHRQDQEKLLQEQKQVLKELKDHKVEDAVKKKGESAEKLKELKEGEQKEDLKNEIVKKQQELLQEQQKINQEQQKLILQQQAQLNQQMANKNANPKDNANAIPQSNANVIPQNVNSGLQNNNPVPVVNTGVKNSNADPKQFLNPVDKANPAVPNNVAGQNANPTLQKVDPVLQDINAQNAAHQAANAAQQNAKLQQDKNIESNQNFDHQNLNLQQQNLLHQNNIKSQLAAQSK